MKKKKILMFVALAVVVFAACKKIYNPTTSTTNLNYLVVDGVIDNGTDTTFIKLSRTTTIGSSLNGTNELKATVKIESDHAATYTLTEKGLGFYYYVGVNLTSLQNTYNYRLRIKTAKGVEYLSDYVPVKSSPGIDSVNYRVADDGLHILVNTHDVTASTRYYRWDFVETWQFHSEFTSGFTSNGVKIVVRPAADQIYNCWASNSSGNVILGSTAKLSRDVLVNQEVAYLAPTSQKISVKYSMLLKQYALTTAAFTYWENVKKNNESLGTIFDSQPSEIKGNIRNTANADEPVIGYISIGKIDSKRIFISKASLPRAWDYEHTACLLDTIPTAMENQWYIAAGAPLIPIAEVINPFNGSVLGHSGSTQECVDCRLKFGGANKQPAFWQ